MKRIIAIALALLLVTSLNTGCGNQEIPATTNNAIGATEAPASVEAEQTVETGPSTTVEDQSYLTLEHLKELTWEELLDSTNSPVTTEDQCLCNVITALEKMGRVFRWTTCCMPSTTIDPPAQINMERLEEKLNLVLEAYTNSGSTYWDIGTFRVERNIDFFTEETTQVLVDIRSEEFQLKYPVQAVGEYVLVIDNSIPPASSPANFGFDSQVEVNHENPNPVEIGDIMIVSGFSYLTEMGELLEDINVPFQEFESLCAAILRVPDSIWMVHLCDLDGNYAGSFFPDTVIPLSAIHPEDLSEEQLNALSEQLPDINIEEMLRPPQDPATPEA